MRWPTPIARKLCGDCKKKYQPTGLNQKRCPDCRKKLATKNSYAWNVKTGKIKNPGIGSGNGAGSGKAHHSYRSDAQHLNEFRKFMKDACERCGSTKFLCAHHKDRDRLNGKRSNCETLCKGCHQKEHEAHKNFMVGFDEKRRQGLSANMTRLNKILPRKNGRNTTW